MTALDFSSRANIHSGRWQSQSRQVNLADGKSLLGAYSCTNARRAKIDELSDQGAVFQRQYRRHRAPRELQGHHPISAATLSLHHPQFMLHAKKRAEDISVEGRVVAVGGLLRHRARRLPCQVCAARERESHLHRHGDRRRRYGCLAAQKRTPPLARFQL